MDIRKQADAVDLPVTIWGSVARNKRIGGTIAFYTDDSRFENLWRDPTPVVNSGYISLVEVNFSVHDQMPRAVALWQTYRKRWLTRYWQSQGIRVFADLNVAAPHADLNLLGIPEGWRAYATRGYTDRMELTLEEYGRACTRAESEDILFLVVGGGRQVQELCRRRGWVWIPERADVIKGRRFGTNG